MVEREQGADSARLEDGSRQPFWEASYLDEGQPDPFGEPSSEVVDLAGRLPAGARVLDLGCGAGRHALYLAHRGFRVTAVDISPAAIHRLSSRARTERVEVDAWTCDASTFPFGEPFDLIVAHGILHLMHSEPRDALIERIRRATRPGGYNVIAVFTEALPSPPDLAPFTHGLFREGELAARYASWEPVLRRSYILRDEHPGGIRHEHAVEKLVARRPVNRD